MLTIANNSKIDPAVDLPLVDAYMVWTLSAAEKVIGKGGVDEILAESNLGHLIDNYPEDKLQFSDSLMFKDYANISAAIVERCGTTDADKVIEIGRISVQPTLENQGKLFNFAARSALKLLPMSAQVKTVLDSIKSDVDKVYGPAGYETNIRIEDRGDTWAYVDEGCALCAGKTADRPICGIWNGTLEESLYWLTKKEFKVEQVACRAEGDFACVWEVSKKPY